MQEGLVKVTRYVRTVHDGKLVVRRPGDRVTAEEAAWLGLDGPATRPSKRIHGRLPAKWES